MGSTVIVLAAWIAVPVVPGAGRAAGAETAAGQFYDSHFHLTNYIQQGIDVHHFLQIMGTRVGRSTLFGIPLQQQWSYANSGDFAPTYYLQTDAPLYDEDRQSQPDTEAFDNAQIRISDGNIVFRPALFGPGINITDVVDQPMSFDAGVKYRGFAVEGEYYWRRLDNFRGTGVDALPFDHLTDTGFQVQVSAMVVPRTAQLYVSGSKVFGDYGNPSDVRVGVNVFPWKNQVVRWNTEFIHLNRSPVGALSLPYAVGGNGPVFASNLLVNF